MTGHAAVGSPLQGTVVRVAVEAGTTVREGQTLVLIESMKMEHAVPSPVDGIVADVAILVGATVAPGEVLARVMPATAVPPAPEPHATEGQPEAVGSGQGADLPPELLELRQRRSLLEDAARPDAVARRHAQGRRTARQNVADLCDPGSFEEYGGFVVAAQRARRSADELLRRTVADGLVAGIGQVGGRPCAVLSYDYTVLAGTQGQMNHRKKDRLFELVERLRIPVVLFAEGGGGRPGDTDAAVVTGLHTMAFHLFARLSGTVPLVAVVSGRCFAGNAALAGCCDVIIATEEASLGMGGPAMIEGGGLGTVAPDAVGPMSTQGPNGVVDVLVPDDVAAVAAAKQYLSYVGPPVGPPVAQWSAPDQSLLRHVVPPDRRRAYDVHTAVELLADTGSVLELRPQFGRGMVTVLARMAGRPVGIVANNPVHLGGAIDSDGADKAARFLQLCQSYGLPVVFLCDTPGFMVGPDAEATGLVRHASRLFVTGAALTVPYVTVVLRKGYGLGAQAMAGGSFWAPLLTVAWPTGELGGMGLEGAVQLGFRRELEAIADPAERQAAFEQMVARAYEHGKALNVAAHFEIDDVIDPAETRARIVQVLCSWRPGEDAADLAPGGRDGRRGRFIDTW